MRETLMRTDLHLTASREGATAADSEVFGLHADGTLTRLTALTCHAAGCTRVPERALAMTARAEDGPSEPLSARELECMRWVAAGKTDWEIGTILSISGTTVKFHVDRGRAKLGARTRAQATARLVLFG